MMLFLFCFSVVVVTPFLTFLLLFFSRWHNSFSSSTSPLVSDGAPPIFHRHCSYSSTLFFILLLLNVIHVFPWHCSSPTPLRHHFCSSAMFFLLLFLDTVLAPLQHHSYSCFIMSLLLLLLFNTIPFATPFWHHSCSSYCKYLSSPL